MENEQITVPLLDLYSFLHTAIGYAIGRQSYITSVVPQQVRTYWRYLTPDMRRTITRNLQSDVDFYDRGERKMGMDCDDREWRALLAWCQNEVLKDSTEAP